MQTMEKVYLGRRNSQCRDHKGTEYFSLRMTGKPLWLERWQELKEAERLPGTNLTGPLTMVKTVDFALGNTRGHEGFFLRQSITSGSGKKWAGSEAKNI